MIRSGDTQYGLILVMTIKSYNVSAGIRKRPRRFSSCNALDSSWPVAPRGCRDCCAPIGSDLSETGHAVGGVNPPQMTPQQTPTVHRGIQNDGKHLNYRFG